MLHKIVEVTQDEPEVGLRRGDRIHMLEGAAVSRVLVLRFLEGETRDAVLAVAERYQRREGGEVAGDPPRSV